MKKLSMKELEQGDVQITGESSKLNDILGSVGTVKNPWKKSKNLLKGVRSLRVISSGWKTEVNYDDDESGTEYNRFVTVVRPSNDKPSPDWLADEFDAARELARRAPRNW